MLKDNNHSGAQERQCLFEYSPTGRLKNYDDGVTAAEYVYDALGRKTQETVTYPGNMVNTFTYSYYANGLKKTFTMPDGTTYTYTYGANNELTGIDLPGQGQFTYSAFQVNAPTHVSYPGGGTGEYEYDQVLRLTHLTARDPGANPLLEYTYEYDRLGNIHQKHTEHGAYEYEYDLMNRLTQVDVDASGLEDEQYTYDLVGNRTTASNATGTIEHNQNNELNVYGDLHYDYDANGNLTEITLDNQRLFLYTYNVDNRLVNVENGVGTVIAEYGYDPFGRRLWKDVAETRTYFFYSDEGLVAEYDEQGNELRSYGYRPDSVWTTNPLFLKQDGEYYFYQNDHLGTPQKLVATNGRVVWSAKYTAFGQARVGMETVTNNLRFPGQYYDAETGLHYNFHRYYDPVTGRYVNVDPIGFAGGDENLYAYLWSDPVNLGDPYGLYAGELDVLGQLLAALGALAEAASIVATEIASGTGTVFASPVALAGAVFGGILFYPSDIAPEPPIPLPLTDDELGICPLYTSAPDSLPRFQDGLDDLDQLEGIEKAQQELRSGKLKGQKIIDSKTKSKRRLKNRLKRVNDYEDALDDFE